MLVCQTGEPCKAVGGRASPNLVVSDGVTQDERSLAL